MDIHDFIVDGTRYRLVRFTKSLEGFDAVFATESVRLVHHWAQDGRGELLRRLGEGLGVASPVEAHETAASLATRLADALGRPFGSATLLRERRRRLSVARHPEAIINLRDLAEDPSAIDAPVEHWIEIRLVDEAARPIAGERYELSLPDGNAKQGRTDEFGIVRVDPIHKPGNCRIYFPDLAEQLEAAG